MNNQELIVAFAQYRLAKAEAERWIILRNENLKVLENAPLDTIVDIFEKIPAVKIIRDVLGLDLKNALEVYDSIMENRKIKQICRN